MKVLLALRPLNCFMAGLAVIVASWLGNGSEFFSLFLGFLSVFFICGGGMAINDYFDWEVDKINKPKKWRKMKKYGKNALIYLTLITFSIGILLSAFISIPVLILALINSIILIAYSWKLKKILFLKNLTVSYLVASTFIYGGLISQSPVPALIFSLLALLSNTGREIVKDICDVKGDKKRGIKTIPMLIGNSNSALLAATFTFSSVLLSPLPYFIGIFSEVYLIALIPCIISFIYASFISIFSPEKANMWMKIAMLLGLFAFFVGKIMS